MPEITLQDLKKQIKSNSFDNLYFIYGDEAYLKRHYTEMLINKIVNSSFKDFNFHVFNGGIPDMNDFGMVVEALPVMSEYNCILIKDLPADSFTKDNANEFYNIISDIPQTTIIIISMLTSSASPRSAKWKATYEQLKKHGTVVAANKMKIADLAKIIEKSAKARGCDFSYSEAVYLISLVGDDMLCVNNEMEKVCAYAGSGKITKAQIDAVAVKNVEANAFELTKAIRQKNCDKAFEILNMLFYQKTEPVMIMGAMISPYVDMYRAKLSCIAGNRAENAANYFNYKNKEFRLINSAKEASKISVTQLRLSLDTLWQADTMLKTAGINGKLIIEQTIIKLLLIAEA